MGVNAAAWFFIGVAVCLVIGLGVGNDVDNVDIISINSAIERCPSKKYSNITITDTTEGLHYKTKVLCTDGSVVEMKVIRR